MAWYSSRLNQWQNGGRLRYPGGGIGWQNGGRLRYPGGGIGASGPPTPTQSSPPSSPPPGAPPASNPGTPPPPAAAGPAQTEGYDQGQGPYSGDQGIFAAMAMQNSGADQAVASQNQASPALQRITTPPAQMSPPSSNPVWVTVPVDKVEVASGKGTVTPVYATANGYQSPPSGNAIPPTPAAGKA